MRISASVFVEKVKNVLRKRYTKHMKQLVRSVFPAEFFKTPEYWRAFVLGMLYLGFVLTQLFTFEDFSSVTLGYGLPGGMATAVVLAGLIPLTEALSLPFLLSMKLPGWLRRVSRLAVIAVPVLWIALGLWLLPAAFGVGERVNSGLFGATVPTDAGFWLVAFGSILLWAAILTVRELPVRK